ncbi:MAG: 2-oxoglutarate dehydrogenase E1 component [Methylococcaceae bacterium]|nr:2-oxoglutarate dehydrogenase E1 component [Methylococcaceae bacterium]
MKRLQELFEGSSAIAEDNLGFLEDLYARFQRDPDSVDTSWREKFHSIQNEPRDVRTRTRRLQPAVGRNDRPLEDTLRKQAAVDQLIYQYRTRGHQVADNNPLKLVSPPVLKDLDPATYGLTLDDFDQPFYVDILHDSRRLPLRDILSLLRETYCESIGAEYMHIVDSDIKHWIQTRLETSRGRVRPDPETRHALLRALTAAEGIERYLHRKYVGQKRFSLEGAESLIPLLDESIERSSCQGVRELVIGMAHRGRLNVLINVLGKKPSSLFQEFEGTSADSPLVSAGDVKYHMGFSSNIQTSGGPVHIALAFNPSHLEIIDPVVEGSVRARQDRREGNGEDEVMAVLIHGDAAFAGQGVVMETLNMAETRAFTTGGSLHVVVNNQIGFTTSNPFDARSTLYCTDVANMVQAPVFHVNGDDPEAVLFVTQLAVDYRMKFKRDVVIDLICYRRHGHNEADEPAVTQPAMYRYIRQQPTVRKLYADQLIAAGILTAEEEKRLETDYQAALGRDDIVSRPMIDGDRIYPKPSWVRYLGQNWTVPYDSRVPPERLEMLAEALVRLPPGFSLHARAAAIIDSRRAMAAGELPADWGFAENLAYATLLADGYAIRLSGQDVGRGTFFHRHAILYDQSTGDAYAPLQHLPAPAAPIQIFDSLLSEEGVLGFEYGYASSAPEVMVIWEAQFGDFANNAQVVIDQFITSGESKWGRLCGLTLLLPHGYEGQGPEHSSARLERYLQLCAEQNIQVCVPTTPAQIFHLLRRQMLRPYRKPLIVMTPKSLLRHKLAVSSLAELTDGGFQVLIGETDAHEPASVTRVVLCSGKVYYDLIETRRKSQLDHVAILRIEQIYPFPFQAFTAELSRYPQLRELVWCQEEPENQGAWYQIKHRLVGQLTNHMTLSYVGRPRCAAPAVGQFHRHIEQQKQVVQDALFGPSPR